MIAKPVVILTILVVGFVVRWLLHKVIGRIVTRAVTGSLGSTMVRARSRPPEEEERLAVALERRRLRAETLGSVLRSIASITVFTVVAMMVLAELGLNIGPLLASAGLVGVALGFGAQSLVRDFLSGLFIFFEDQYGVGDTVRVNEVEGVVETISLRITRLRDDEGTIWYLRNGEILKVGNVSQRGTLPGEV
jgi:small conductance mechanosensitive channel